MIRWDLLSFCRKDPISLSLSLSPSRLYVFDLDSHARTPPAIISITISNLLLSRVFVFWAKRGTDSCSSRRWAYYTAAIITVGGCWLQLPLCLLFYYMPPPSNSVSKSKPSKTQLVYNSVQTPFLSFRLSSGRVAAEEREETKRVIWSGDLERVLTRRRLVGPGSSPPTCRSKCGRCWPCKPVHVPIQPGVSLPLEYYPEAWRCKCGDKLFMP